MRADHDEREPIPRAMLLPLPRFEWERRVRGLTLPRGVKGVALVLATYAKKDGSNVRPGRGELAHSVDLSERQTSRHLVTIRQLGLVYREQRGGSHVGIADVYQLTMPAPSSLAEVRARPNGEPELVTPTALVDSPTSDTDGTSKPASNMCHPRPALVTPMSTTSDIHGTPTDQEQNKNTTNTSNTLPLPNASRARATTNIDPSRTTTLPPSPPVDLDATEPPDETAAYRAASAALATLPDFGAALIEQTRAETPDASLAALVIAAAASAAPAEPRTAA